MGRPPRPASCVSCEGARIWFDGWRIVHPIVLDGGQRRRFDEGLPLQRVTCSACDQSWTLRPPWLYPQRTFEPDVAEAAAHAYLVGPGATYADTGEALGMPHRLLNS